MKLKIASAALILFPAITVFGYGDATGVAKERMDLMISIAGQMKTIGQMINTYAYVGKACAACHQDSRNAD